MTNTDPIYGSWGTSRYAAFNPWWGIYPPPQALPHYEPLWVTPAPVAQKCPVCCGSGEVLGNTQNCTTNPWPKVCHGCSGKGWVAV
jgi:hypothetical protein